MDRGLTPQRADNNTDAFNRPKIISLFSGAGGLDYGFAKADFEIVFAVDKNRWAVQTYRQAFPETCCIQADLTELGAEGVVRKISEQLRPGDRIGVIGGPPCQGFSRSNAKSEPDDPRNRLPFLYLDTIKALRKTYKVDFIIFENVLGIKDNKHTHIFNSILSSLNRMGFHRRVKEYDAYDFGVPQHRRRVIIAAFASRTAAMAYRPVTQMEETNRKKTVRDAIENLPEPSYCSRRSASRGSIHPNHWTMNPKSPRFAHPELFKSYGRSFRKLEWDAPSPTVAYGHREIHVHPNGKRRLSIYEAMLLQGFPSTYELFGPFSAQVEQVSNAVPPPLAFALAIAVKNALSAVDND